MTSEASQTRGGRSRRVLAAAAFVTGGFVLGVVSLAAAAPDGVPWQGMHHHGPRIGMIQHVVRRALDNVGATTAQEDKIHDIIATTATQMQADGAARDGLRKQLLDVLKAPTLDRAAIEKMRQQKVAEFDAKSKTIAEALVQAADQLSPDQRAKLAQTVEERMEHGDWGRWRHQDRMEPHDGAEGGDRD